MSDFRQKMSSDLKSPFTRSQTYRSFRGVATFHSKKNANQVIPSAVSLSPHSKHGKHGYLWRLSSKRLVYTPEWKRKYCVLSDGGYLYYYENESSLGGERGSGVIDLRCVIDCVEAPLTDHKKATNVFILIAKERGFFDQGRYYLSAETLFDMKDWVKRIKLVLKGILETEGNNINMQASTVTSIVDQSISRGPEFTIPEPLYASIKEESIHRSNSMSTLPSLCNDRAEAEYLNRSMDECPVLGISSMDHNLTYSYSSSDDSLNESFTINFSQKSPRSAETSLGRKGTKNKPMISMEHKYQGNQNSPVLYSRPVFKHSTPTKAVGSSDYIKKMHEDVDRIKPMILVDPKYQGNQNSPVLYSRPVFKHSTPTKAVDSSDYIKKMHEDMDRIDKQLEMVTRVESDLDSKMENESTSGQDSMNTDFYSHEDIVELNGGKELVKMDKVMQKMKEESEKMNQILENIQKRTSPASGTAEHNSELIEMAAKYQKTVAEVQSQALELLLEIHSTQAKVVRSLEEAEEAKQSYWLLKKQAEHLLGQLQVL
eukprot:GFUD01064149.1.p1 GENE.GFUD01064149.1~~GFUD01064149.1.p1  ORF type:complete len:542 (+),score=142.40 GFUD01064149.1:157-1782(+)